MVEDIVPELTAVRIKSWADTCRRTSQLPVAAAQLCKFLGRNAHKKILSSLYALVGQDKSLRGPCEEIVTCMAKHSPCLCPVSEMNDFVKHLRREGGSLEDKVWEACVYVLEGLNSRATDLRPSHSHQMKNTLHSCLSSAIRVGVSVGEYVEDLKNKHLSRQQEVTEATPISEKASVAPRVVFSGDDIGEVCQQLKDACSAAFTACSVEALSKLENVHSSSRGSCSNYSSEVRVRLAGVLSLSCLKIAESACLFVCPPPTPMVNSADPIPTLPAESLSREGELVFKLARGVLSVFGRSADDMQSALHLLILQALSGSGDSPPIETKGSGGMVGYGDEENGFDLWSTAWSLVLIDSEVSRYILYSVDDILVSLALL